MGFRIFSGEEKVAFSFLRSISPALSGSYNERIPTKTWSGRSHTNTQQGCYRYGEFVISCLLMRVLELGGRKWVKAVLGGSTRGSPLTLPQEKLQVRYYLVWLWRSGISSRHKRRKIKFRLQFGVQLINCLDVFRRWHEFLQWPCVRTTQFTLHQGTEKWDSEQWTWRLFVQPLEKNKNASSLFLLVLSVLKKQVFSQLCIFPEPPKCYFSSLCRKYSWVPDLWWKWGKRPAPVKLEGTDAPKGNPSWSSKNFYLTGCLLQNHHNRSMFLLPRFATSSVIPKITYSCLKPSYLKLEAP